VDSTSCEMDGIALGLELLLQYFTDGNKTLKSDEDAYILCDSSAATDLILCRNDNCKRSDFFKRITELEKLLSAINISVYLSWIPWSLWYSSK